MPPASPLRAPNRALLAFALLLLLAAAVWWRFGAELTPEALADSHAALTEWRQAQGARAVLGFFAATALAALVSLPGIAVFTLAGGLLFGALWGTLLVVAAATLGATGPYALARAGFGDGLWRRLEAGRAGPIADGLKQNEISTLLLLRMMPVVPFLLANTLPALMGVRLWRYVLTTFVGLIPGTTVLALAGRGLGDLAASGGSPAAGTLGAVIIGVPLVMVATALAVRLLRRRTAPPAARP